VAGVAALQRLKLAGRFASGGNLAATLQTLAAPSPQRKQGESRAMLARRCLELSGFAAKARRQGKQQNPGKKWALPHSPACDTL